MPAMTDLGQANTVRKQRKEMRQLIAGMPVPEAREMVCDLLRDPPDNLYTLAIADLLDWLPGYGQKSVNTICSACDVNPVALVGGLRPRNGRDDGLVLRRADRDRIIRRLEGPHR